MIIIFNYYLFIFLFNVATCLFVYLSVNYNMLGAAEKVEIA